MRFLRGVWNGQTFSHFEESEDRREWQRLTAQQAQDQYGASGHDGGGMVIAAAAAREAFAVARPDEAPADLWEELFAAVCDRCSWTSWEAFWDGGEWAHGAETTAEGVDIYPEPCAASALREIRRRQEEG